MVRVDLDPRTPVDETRLPRIRPHRGPLAGAAKAVTAKAAAKALSFLFRVCCIVLSFHLLMRQDGSAANRLP